MDDLFHDTCCACAYCELERDEKTETYAVIRRQLAWAGALLTLGLLFVAAWLAL